MALTGQVEAKQKRDPREAYLTGFQWHLGEFVIINVLFWTLDLTLGQSGAQWAFWITGFWGLALALHLLAYLVDGRKR